MTRVRPSRRRFVSLLGALGLAALLGWILLGPGRGGASRGPAEAGATGPAAAGAAPLVAERDPATADVLEHVRARVDSESAPVAAIPAPATARLELDCWDGAAGAPAAQVPIEIERIAEDWPFEPVASLRSDDAGAAAVSVPSGARLLVMAGMEAGYAARAVKVGPLLPGETRRVVLRLLPQSRHTLRFLVQDPAGRPLPEALLRALDGEPVPAVRTGADGIAELREISAEYGFVVAIEKPGYERGFVLAAVQRDGPSIVVVSLRPEAILRGTVVDGGGRPVADAELELRTSGAFFPYRLATPIHRWTARSDEAGAFHFTGLTPGLGHLLEARIGAECATLLLPPLAAGETEVAAVLQPAAALAGVVLDPAGGALAGATLEAWPIRVLRGSPPGFLATESSADGSASREVELEGLPRLRARSGGDGRFQWSGLPPGRWRLALAATGEPWLADPLDVELAAGATTEAVLLTRTGLEIRGFLVDAAGVPLTEGLVSAAPIAAEDGAAPPVRGARTRLFGADGAFVLAPLEPGRYDLAGEMARLGLSGDLAGIEAGATGVLLTLHPAAPLRGRVLGSDGRPRRADLLLIRRGRDSDEAWFPATDAEGEFSLALSNPGTWDLIASTGDGWAACAPGIEVRAGAPAELTVRLVAAGRVSFALPAGAAGTAEVRLRGETIYAGPAAFLRALRWLPEGELAVTLAGGGAAAAGTVLAGQPLVLELAD